MSSGDPYDDLPDVPEFELTSQDIRDGEPLGAAQVLHGGNTSPQLSWSGFPEGTKSFAVTLLDPDAPTPSGYWHWAAFNIPAATISLAAGAGDGSGSGLPSGAIQLKGDGGTRGYEGANPPKGHGPHRYMFVVHAVDVAALDLPDSTTPAALSFNLHFHTLGRARITGTYEQR